MFIPPTMKTPLLVAFCLLCTAVPSCRSLVPSIGYCQRSRFVSRLQSKSDDALRAQVYCDIEKIIEAWVQMLQGKPPTDAQAEDLNSAIFDLDQLFEKQRMDGQLDDWTSTNTRATGVVPDNIAPVSAKPATLIELIHFILGSFDDERLRELEFKVAIRKCPSIYFESRVEFETAVNDVQPDRMEDVCLGKPRYNLESVQEAYDDIQAMLRTPQDLVKRINSLLQDTPSHETALRWDETLVEPTNIDDLGRITFCPDFAKASALVVAGESGSGKTWFCQKYIPNKLGEQDLALLYYSIVDGDGHDKIKANDSLKSYRMACGIAMNFLYKANRSDGYVYQDLSDLAMAYNKDRDTMAESWLKIHIDNILSKDVVLSDWWNSEEKPNYKPIEKLVLVVDEVGKNLELALALVSIVRKLYRHIKMSKAKQVLLVLVGSGLERHICYDCVSALDTEMNRARIASFGTDPMKSEIIILKGPDLTRKMMYGIPTNSILRGTYSRVLSTNTRMLTRGVVPMMKIPEFTQFVPGSEVSAQYEALGSTNIVMDYAARSYVALNGLARRKFGKDELERILLAQFKILLHASLAGVKHSNPAFHRISEGLNITTPKDLDEISALGLVTADVRSTSPALRYLACNGKTAPLDAQDGISFEIMVQYHLVRLCEAWNKKDGSLRWVGRYNLRQAWPPRSTKAGEKLSDDVVTRNEVENRYHNDDDDRNNDIDVIYDLLKNKGDCDLVMRQTVTNAQGADLMILNRKDGKIFLHLFQCKNVKKIPGMKSRKLVEYFWSLGVKVDKGGKNINVAPESGSGGYSYLGTQHFAKKLGEKLQTNVEIGHRILVLSKEWEEELDIEFLKKAEEKGVMVWTREMLEPTISALYTSGRR